MSFLGKLRHQFCHLLGTNGGHVERWWVQSKDWPEGEMRMMIGFRCEGCGKLLATHFTGRVHRTA